MLSLYSQEIQWENIKNITGVIVEIHGDLLVACGNTGLANSSKTG